ncbi:hypothetical protein ElyMa_002731200, partial [Elysia marginata]
MLVVTWAETIKTLREETPQGLGVLRGRQLEVSHAGLDTRTIGVPRHRRRSSK